MTPEGALAAALHRGGIGCSYEEHGHGLDASEIAAQLPIDGFSLVPTADLDRLRAVAGQCLDYFTLSAGDYHDRYGDTDEPLAALRAALGDRAAEEGP